MLFSECFTRLISLNPHKPTRLCLRSILQVSDFEMKGYVQEVYGGMPLGSTSAGSEGHGTRTEGGGGVAKPGSCSKGLYRFLRELWSWEGTSQLSPLRQLDKVFTSPMTLNGQWMSDAPRRRCDSGQGQLSAPEETSAVSVP